MTTALDRVPVASISAQARQVQAGRTLLRLLTGLFYVIGWVAFRVCAVAWLAMAWCAVATREGWRDARKVNRGPARTG